MTIDAPEKTDDRRAVTAPSNNATHAPAAQPTRAELTRRLNDARARKYELEMSDDRADTNGRLDAVGAEIRALETQLANTPGKR